MWIQDNTGFTRKSQVEGKSHIRPRSGRDDQEPRSGDREMRTLRLWRRRGGDARGPLPFRRVDVE